ncbi:hypothetical protein JRQ81_019126 [Phrynocephalus forsythii]|uniref:Uncharacterized protein n=1 Tax=Phrynocephalus forsythii TaxID=171643 RepID=A0A9Q0XLB9_9SAUR|nr:hypothetical protein JRQ81_019126 [Phrynocephalus forsythii]
MEQSSSYMNIGETILTLSAWGGICQHNLDAAWHNLWPGCVVPPDASEPAPEFAVVEEIVSLGRTMGLDVNKEDMSELVKGHEHKLSTQDLMEL